MTERPLPRRAHRFRAAHPPNTWVVSFSRPEVSIASGFKFSHPLTVVLLNGSDLPLKYLAHKTQYGLWIQCRTSTKDNTRQNSAFKVSKNRRNRHTRPDVTHLISRGEHKLATHTYRFVQLSKVKRASTRSFSFSPASMMSANLVLPSTSFGHGSSIVLFVTACTPSLGIVHGLWSVA